MKRNEIIQVNGAVILIVMIIVANALAIGIIDRYARFQYFTLTKAQAEAYSVELGKVRKIKNEIVALEGAPNWEATAYATYRPGNAEQRAVEAQ